MTFGSKQILAVASKSLSLLPYHLLFYFAANITTGASCGIFIGICFLALFIPWQELCTTLLALVIIALPPRSLVTYLRDHPLSEKSALHAWSGLWLLPYTAPTMKVYRLLQKAGIVHYRLPSLPTEVWCHILDFALDIPEALGTTCKSEGVLEYIYYHRFQQYIRSGDRVRMHTKPSSSKPRDYEADPSHPYEAYMRQRATLSLVCSGWNSIVQRRHLRWAVGDMEGVRTAERLELISNYTELTTKYNQSSYAPSPGAGSTRLRVVAMNDSLRINDSTERPLSTLAKYRPDVVQGLRCVSYIGPGIGHFHLIWKMLNNLTTLIIETAFVDDLSIELPNLQVLMVKSWAAELRNWRCPSLEHFILAYADDNYSTLYIDIPKIISPSNLVSFIVYNRRITLDAEFWQTHPSLVHLGSSTIDYEHPPPRNHPLSHISIIDPLFSQVIPHGFRCLIDSGHPFKSVRFPPRPREEPVYNQWNELYWHVRRLGILGPPIPTAILEHTVYQQDQGWKGSGIVIPADKCPWPRPQWWIERWLANFMKGWSAFPENNESDASAPVSFIIGGAIGGPSFFQFFVADRWNWQTFFDLVKMEVFGLGLSVFLVIAHAAYLELFRS